MRSSKLSDKPKQYKDGWVEFYKLKFKVTPDVLIPRPETELLVDEVLTHVGGRPTRLEALTILEIGTGAGNIAISIAKNSSLHPKGGHIKIIATDISSKALKVAQQNAKLQGVSDQIKFIQSDLLASLNQYIVRSHTIMVTNLPYIPSSRIPYLDSSVRDFEPHIALDGGEDGFDLYRKLFAQISQQLRELQPKLIVGEIDYTHGELAISEAQKYFPEAKVEVKLDLAHKQRILLIR